MKFRIYFIKSPKEKKKEKEKENLQEFHSLLILHDLLEY